jgi:hypothetical protein
MHHLFEDRAGQAGGAAKTHPLGSGQHIDTNDQLMGELGISKPRRLICIGKTRVVFSAAPFAPWCFHDRTRQLQRNTNASFNEIHPINRVDRAVPTSTSDRRRHPVCR